jgi:hypothetical protein
MGKEATKARGKKDVGQVQRFLSAIPALRRMSQEAHQFKASLDWVVKPCLKTQIQEKKERKRKPDTTSKI